MKTKQCAIKVKQIRQRIEICLRERVIRSEIILLKIIHYILFIYDSYIILNCYTYHFHK
jgi:hypothetical protein